MKLRVACLCVLVLLAIPAGLSVGAQSEQQMPREIRVGIGWQVLPTEVTVTPRGAGATIRACPTCAASRLGAALTITAQESALRVSGHTELSNEVRLDGDYELVLQGRPPLHSRFPATLRQQSHGIRIVLQIPLEDYVVLALSGESADFTSEAALRAMAVAVRTYAISQRGRHESEHFDLCDTTHCQLLRFDDAAPARLRAAAEATEGELLWYRGEPAITFYSRNCAGTTEDGRQVWPGIAAPYLRSHTDPYCVLHGRNEWNAEISKHDLAAALDSERKGPRDDQIVSVRVLERTPAGRVAQVQVRGDRTMQIFTGEGFRTAVARSLGSAGLRSNTFEVTDVGDRLIFHGYGAGHGAGLCQAGAQEMGLAGKTYREILAFYYPGTTLGLSAQGLDWVRVGGERLDVMTVRPATDRALVERAERALREAEERAGWQLGLRPEVRVYPSVAVYRNATGEPGWVAASTRGRTIRMEPTEVLAGAVNSTLRHEFLHLLIEGRARPGVPLWFREGLTLYLNGEQEEGGARFAGDAAFDSAALDRAVLDANSAAAQRAAYQRVRAAVARLVAAHGRAEVLSWLERGLPANP